MVVDHDQDSSSQKRSLATRDQSKPSHDNSLTKLDDHGIFVIDPNGDLVLQFEHELDVRQTVKFKVNKDALRQASAYFRLLLDPTRFEEGRKVAEFKGDGLPAIFIEDVGRISEVKALQMLLADFLRILHGQNVLSFPPPIANLANLVAVADRFDSLSFLRTYVYSKRIPQLIDSKSGRSKSGHIPEDKLRQRCLIAILLDYSPWLLSASQRLIQRSTLSSSPNTATVPLWQDLPAGLETEMHCRRLYILDTIQSLQTYFLSQYTSRTRQCRLGYDSSGACDSFQLGEMVRFFAKIGTLNFTGSLVQINDARDEADYAGDLKELIDKMRQCPEYQIDSNHHHCGLRTRLMPLLDQVEKALEDSGICGDCWSTCRSEYSWAEAKRPLIWRRDNVQQNVLPGMDKGRSCLARHLATRNMCMATDRVWEVPRDGLGPFTTWK